MEETFIINGVRTPIGNLGGALAAVRTDDLAAHVLAGLLRRNPGLDPSCISDVIMGCANQAGEDNRNVARMALLLAGYPHTVPGQTVNRLCASGMAAAMDASRMIKVGEAELAVAGGVENMTRGPWVISKSASAYGRDQQMFDSSFGWRFINPKMKEIYGVDGMGDTAENLCMRDNIARQDQDAFAAWSQEKAVKAQNFGRLQKEIIPVSVPQRKGDPIVFSRDEFIKEKTTVQALSLLRPAFKKDGSVTAGNSSGLNDGAAALLLASGSAVKKYGLKPMARVISSGAVGVEPKFMGIGPVEASYLALKRAGLTMAQMDIIELNEAFAAQALACTRAWGLKDQDNRINVNGGAIALGHPLGMSGTRILLSAAMELKERNKRYALATMCIGVGQGYAVVIENAE
ncbi:MAG: acetyl-CoA C-acyltransferase [Bacteroidia bacterium]|nr:acetyl-CoA C-acyltransferase [Bacteroidia bacterium]